MQARPTVYKGVQMRSRLEANFAQQCDRSGLSWRYEPGCFADDAGQHLPDFSLDESAYVEVKPDAILSTPVGLNVALRRMGIIWSSEPLRELHLVVGVGYPVSFDTYLIALGAGDRRWRAYGDNIPSWLQSELGD